ncbi:MAG: HAD family phosphatase [Candidatus Omnitrophota bacterium]
MKNQIRTKAIIFDMDGVITNTMPDHYRVWSSLFRAQGIPASRLDVYKREGQRGIDSVLEIFQEHQKGISLKEAQNLLTQKEKMFKKIVKQRFIPGARRFLRTLHRQGFQLGLVTGTSRHELRKILPESIAKRFDVIITGSDVKNGKPHPEPYLTALKKLKQKSRNAVVIENAPFGIQSAKKAKLRCFAIATSLSKYYLKEADDVFGSIKELQKRNQFIKS